MSIFIIYPLNIDNLLIQCETNFLKRPDHPIWVTDHNLPYEGGGRPSHRYGWDGPSTQKMVVELPQSLLRDDQPP